jgi:hypothetical protein
MKQGYIEQTVQNETRGGRVECLIAFTELLQSSRVVQEWFAFFAERGVKYSE